MNKTHSIGLFVLTCLLVVSFVSFPLKALSGQAFGLLAFALVLEMSAVQLPTLGFISASFPIFFVLTFLPTGGPVITSVGLVLVFLLRSVLRSRQDLGSGLTEFCLDAFSVMTAVLVGGWLSDTQTLRIKDFPVSLLAILASLLTYYFCQTWLYAKALQQQEVAADLYLAQTEAVNLQTRASSMSAPALYLLVLQGPWQILWTLPIFLALHQSNWDRLSELRKARQEKTVAKVENVKKDRVLLAAAKNMAELQSQKRLVHNCSTIFSKTRNTKECFDALLEIVGKLVAPDSVALMVYRQQLLKPLFCRSPHSERFFNQAKNSLREDVISKAWSTGEIQQFNSASTQTRIFESEQHALAFPLHGQGVLYLGSQSRAIEGEALQKLATVVYQFSLSLQSTQREETLVSTLEQVKEANRQIALGKERLLTLLQGSHQMTRTLESVLIVEQTSQTLLSLFQPSYLLIRVCGLEDFSQGSPPPQSLLETAIQGVTEGQDSYYLEALQSEAGQAAFTGHQLSWENRSLGFLLMSSEHRDHFSKAQRRFLELLALHCSVMLTNATLYSDVKKARQDLEESQAQLVQSSKLAAVGQLAAGVAHELNTPLGAVLLSIQAANRQLKKERYEKIQDKLKDAVKGAQAAKEIVSKLLFYSREGREDDAEVDLGEIVRDTVGFLGSQISDVNIKLSHNIQEGCRVRGNQNELQQILTNLLVNARDSILESACQDGRIQIEVAQRNGRALLSVMDNGSGFAQETKDKAFDPFFTTKAVGQGTGLGLHVSRQIAERHEGSLEVQSQPGQGATLILSLPNLTESSGADRHV